MSQPATTARTAPARTATARTATARTATARTATARTATAPAPAPASQPARPARPAARAAARPAARMAGATRLRVVGVPRHARSRPGLVVACVGLLLVGLVGLLLLNVSLERGAYDLRDQSARAEQLREQAQKYAQEARELAAPGALADSARKLGMVDAPRANAFLLPDGRTLGVAEKAAASSSPTVSAAAPSASTHGAGTTGATTGATTGPRAGAKTGATARTPAARARH